jgi:hypothetical protein
MFEEAGHSVVGWRRLSPKLQDYQTIVWFPDDFKPPTPQQRTFLEGWLATEPGRTLVYVGRDYDASVDYWMRRNAPRRSARALSGPWATGVDETKAEILLAGRLEPPSDNDLDKWMARAPGGPKNKPQADTLLASDNEAVVTRFTCADWDQGQMIVVTNGSFLLNLPLVNHEHRKLAGKLIASCSDGRTVFLESEAGGPPIFDKEPGANAPTGFEVFTVWPIGVILVHLTALGFLACLTLFPVFGRPREFVKSSTTDFGQHVEALGELLQQTGDRDYAVQRVRTYHELVRRDTTATPGS